MLLRSSSTPLLNSLCANHDSEPNVSAASVFAPRIPRNLSASSVALCVITKTKMARAMSDTNLKEMCSPVMKAATTATATTTNRLFSMEEEEGCGGGDRGGGRRSCGGRGRGRGDGGDGDATDVYYQSMIQANPGNSLLLSNYAKYLNEVRGDYVLAEEYCGRALLADPTDGEVLSIYADLVWKTERDAPRAETYFDQAVKAAPDDCYVMASYAKFLWDTEEEDDDLEEELETNDVFSSISTSTATSINMWHGFQAQSPPIATAS